MPVQTVTMVSPGGNTTQHSVEIGGPLFRNLMFAGYTIKEEVVSPPKNSRAPQSPPAEDTDEGSDPAGDSEE